MLPLKAADPRQVGDYTTLGRLGHGAMGIVFLARSPGGRLVALKVVRDELTDEPGFRDRFRREVAAMRTVGGFWTAAVVDADPDADAPWVASEYVPGPDLHRFVTDQGPLSVSMARALTAGLAEALRVIHGAGLVHRDLKPANVLLASDGPRVIDFGIASVANATGLTMTGVFMGTPGFLAPEQIEGKLATPASDVFALGAVVAYAVTGTGPFGNGDVASLLYRSVHGEPDLAAVPPELRQLLARCLARTPRERPTPQDLLSEISTFDTVEWLPDREGAEQQRTELTVPATPRPATRPYTVVYADPAVPPTMPPPANIGRTVFATSRTAAVVKCTAAALGMLLLLPAVIVKLSTEQATRDVAEQVSIIVYLTGIVLFAAWLARQLPTVLRPRRRLEVSAAGLVVHAGTRQHTVAWPEVSRVRLIANGNRPWLVVWLGGLVPASRHLGRLKDGGHRVFPIRHLRRWAVREREIREIRAALQSYAGAAYDPAP